MCVGSGGVRGGVGSVGPVEEERCVSMLRES